MRKAGPFLILFIILVLPLLIYLFLRTGTHVVQPLRTVSEKIADPGGGPDSVYKAVGKFAFQSHTGNMIDQDSFAGKIWVANVFTAECKDECATVMQGMRDVQEYYESSEDVRFLSLFVPLPGDTMPDLKQVASHYNAIDHKWDMVTGTNEQVSAFAKGDLAFGNPIPDSGAAYKPNYTLRLVDQQGLLRGAYYDALEPKEIDSVISHIRLLQRELEQGLR